MSELKSTPPPLVHSPTTSDRGRESTAESTPINTPVSAVATTFGATSRARRGKDLYFSWHKKPADSNPTFLDSDVLFEDDDSSADACFPLFPDSPPLTAARGMDGAPAAPLDITTPPRFSSQSPRNQQSNLTFALQEAGAIPDQQPSAAVPTGSNGNFAGTRTGNDGRLSVSGRQDSISNGMNPSSFFSSGARQIPGVRERPRRESVAGSFANGMSWGGISVGSWVRDDILMAGTSPYAFHQSPSFHSSSYLPKMEANFLRDYECCGIHLDSLHELLQHYEEVHAQPSAQILQRPLQGGQMGLGAAGRAGPGIGVNVSGAHGAQASQAFAGAQAGASNQLSQQQQAQHKTTAPAVQDVDPLDDMEMDDTAAPMTPMQQNFGYPQQQQQAFNNHTPQVPPLNMNLANAMHTHQGLRSSTPTTPSSTFNFANNPTVSSVNTPALSTQQLPGQGLQKSPETSMPSTPLAEFGTDSLDFNNLGNMPMMQGMDMMSDPNFDWASVGGAQNFGGLPNDMSGLTIDEPAKRLFSKPGAGLTQQQLQYMLRTGQLGNDTDLARAVQQQLAGRLGGVGLEQENKPFKCPVIGCEKAYKNQNGLKYHKQHGHQNQQLKDNNDGTFSIVDPLTSIPYPGTVGMEKEKPYRCEVCGKRYKNLNGLKYHRQHSPPCNPDLKLNMPNLAGLNVNVNVAGAGLPVGDMPGMSGF